MSEPFDLVVLGAGPAGAAAAVRARSLGLSVAVVDEAPHPGGQVYRAPSDAITITAPDADHARGQVLRGRMAESGATILSDHRIWTIAPGFVVDALGEVGPRRLAAPALIVATGALERHVPVQGWTLPGVIGLAAATVLLKAHGVLPGRRVAVAGSGPLLMLVAAKILAAGGEVAAVVDAAPRSAWLSRIGPMAARPDLALKGAGWLLRLVLARVPILSGHAVRRVVGADGVEAVMVGPVDRHGCPAPGEPTRIDVDALCLGFGLMPSTEITRLLGADHRFEPSLGGWIPHTDETLQTSVPGLFVAGDAGGVRGADAAPLSGELAALGVARRLGRGSPARDAEAARLALRWRRAGSFGSAMSAVAMPSTGAAAAIEPDTTVCRCEGLTRRVLDAAIAAGSTTLDSLKSTTRCGMGPCGGRVCEEAAAMLLSLGTGLTRGALGQGSARPPLRPIPLAAIAGDFDYDDLPIPAPAPL